MKVAKGRKTQGLRFVVIPKMESFDLERVNVD
jgi:hypothetical protein